MTRWDAGLGGDPLQELEDACEAAQDRRPPTWGCRVFGCKHVPDGAIVYDELPCGCNSHVQTYYLVGGDTLSGRVIHSGCCRNCGNPIIPTARIARR